MLFRRLSDSLRAQNVTGVFLDLVIVIAGIFLGMQASEWYEGRREIALEESILLRLRSEFELIVDEADSAIRFHQSEIEMLDRAYQSLRSGEIQAVAGEPFSDALDKAFYSEFGPSRSGTYVETLSSGQFRLVRDRAIRTALNRYDDYVLEAKSLFSGFQEIQRNQRVAIDRYLTHGPAVALQSESTGTGVFYLRGPIDRLDFERMAADEDALRSIKRLVDVHTDYQICHTNIRGRARNVLALLAAD